MIENAEIIEPALQHSRKSSSKTNESYLSFFARRIKA
jgi:hypothetical protein